jgi:hypothetical protein
MNAGVSTAPWPVVNLPARAALRLSFAKRVNSIGYFDDAKIQDFLEKTRAKI